MANPLAASATLWRNLTPNQKSALGVAALLLIVVVSIAVHTATAKPYKQLFGNLTPEDTAAVRQKLQEMKVRYRVAGNSIEVPADQVDNLRLDLAGDGIPKGGNVGFELFDKTQMGQSEFGERLNYQRALQGELQRTIEQLGCVKSARVHLALPERALYAAEEQPPTASVVLNLQGPPPSAREVKAIIHLVAAAVEGLSPEHVTVVDTDLNLLSDTAGDGSGGMRLQAQRAVERQVEERVQSMLDQVLGAGKAVVRANARMSFARTKIARETYTPVTTEGAQGVLESQHSTVETYSGSGRTVPMGTTGTVPNTTVFTPGNATGSPNTYSREEKANEYRVSKQVEEIDEAPGKVERITLALFVDKSVKQDQLEQLTQTVAAAAGVDPKTDVSVQSVAFDTSAQQAAAAEEKKQAKTRLYTTLGKYALAGILIAGFLVFLLVIYRTALAPVTAQIVTPEELTEVPQPFPLLPPADEGEEEGGQQFASLLAGLDEPGELLPPEETSLLSLEPERVAKVIKEMLADER